MKLDEQQGGAGDLYDTLMFLLGFTVHEKLDGERDYFWTAWGLLR